MSSMTQAEVTKAYKAIIAGLKQIGDNLEPVSDGEFEAADLMLEEAKHAIRNVVKEMGFNV